MARKRANCPYHIGQCVYHSEDEDITGEIEAIFRDGRVAVHLDDHIGNEYSNAQFNHVVSHWIEWEPEQGD